MRAGEQIAASLGAEPTVPGSLASVESMVEQLAGSAGIPMPALWIDPSSDPQAVAAGESPYVSVVVISSGLLARLESPELRAVLAHEVAHIALGHTADRTADVLLRHGRTLSAAGFGAWGIGSLLSHVHPAFALAGSLSGLGLQLASSKVSSDAFVHNRNLEFEADAHASEHGLGPHLATGLIKLERAQVGQPGWPGWASSMSFLGSIDASSHPPSRERIDRALRTPSAAYIRCWACFGIRSSDACGCGAGSAPERACWCGRRLSPWDRYCGECGTLGPEGGCTRCGTVPTRLGSWCSGCGCPRP